MMRACVRRWTPATAAAVPSTSKFFCATCAASAAKIWATDCHAQAFLLGRVGLCTIDADADAIPDCDDTCSSAENDADADADGVCDTDDACPADPENDGDGDGLCDGTDDPCPGDAVNVDADADGVCDGVDACVDVDGDEVCDHEDSCPGGYSGGAYTTVRALVAP